MFLVEIEKLLNKTIGLDAASIGSSSIERAVQERLSACNLKDPDIYWQTLLGSETELQELIEAVIVPETWFFRHGESFAALGRMVQEWLQNAPPRPFRLLSLPCSTGEEPFSMAMTMSNAGVPPNRFRVDAVDVSARALAAAMRGIYRANAFRSKDLGYRDRYFERKGTDYHLVEAVRTQVQFRQGNLFTDGLLPGAEIYDVIFCRNVLIYFDPSAQERAVKVLERLLTAAGILFVGPSETALLLRSNFSSVKVPLAFAFRKGKPPLELKLNPAPIAARSSTGGYAPRPASRTLVQVRPERKAAIPKQESIATLSKTLASALDEAVRVADAGKSSEAAVLCQNLLRTYGPSADALHLLGLLSDAGGQHAEAVRCYRQALYLDPNHRESLAHLALLLETLGRKPEAQVLRNRASRLKDGGRK